MSGSIGVRPHAVAIRAGLVAALAVAALAAWAPGDADAAASNVRIERTPATEDCAEPGSCGSLPGALLAVVAPAGDPASHSITVASTTGGFTVTDAAGVVAGTDCVQLSPTSARCPGEVVSFGELRPVDLVRVIAAEGADLVDLTGLSGAVSETNGLGGDDTLAGGERQDQFRGGSGADVGNGGTGIDRLAGGRGPDRLKGGSGPDTLKGGRGADKLRGNAGSDRLVGGRGIDKLFSRDNREDAKVNCGRGNDRRERAVADRSDDPTSC